MPNVCASCESVLSPALTKLTKLGGRYVTLAVNRAELFSLEITQRYSYLNKIDNKNARTDEVITPVTLRYPREKRVT